MRFIGERDVRNDSGYRVDRERIRGETHFVVVDPWGTRLYWFGDPISAEAEARCLEEVGRLDGLDRQ